MMIAMLLNYEIDSTVSDDDDYYHLSIDDDDYYDDYD